MIEINNSQVELKFRRDISMFANVSEDRKIGYVAFDNVISPDESTYPRTSNEALIPEDYPVVMSFTKIKSVNALISELQHIKENMIEETNLEEEV